MDVFRAWRAEAQSAKAANIMKYRQIRRLQFALRSPSN
jgi:hypothetical protein